MQLICAIATSRYILGMHILYVLFCINPLLLSYEIQSVEIHKRVGAFAMALQTINKCLSYAVCTMARSMLDGESRAAALIQSGNEILETARYSSEASLFFSSAHENWLFLVLFESL
jgi:hypothetical protein